MPKITVPQERIAFLIIGRSGAGKTEVGRRIRANLMRAELFPMAEELKTIAASMGWDGAKDDAGRKLLQDIGSAGRAYNEDVWVEFAIAKWHQLRWSGDCSGRFSGIDVVFVSDDVRYLNEITRVRDAFKRVFVIRVDREKGSKLSGEAAAHISEQEWQSFQVDYVVKNDYSLRNLDLAVTEMVSGLAAKMS